MPTLSSIHLPKPKDWSEFEEISLDAAKLRWSNPNFTRYGRQGQKQNGVDIYGPDELNRLIGIQCKNTINNISKSIIDAEVTRGLGVKSHLDTLQRDLAFSITSIFQNSQRRSEAELPREQRLVIFK